MKYLLCIFFSIFLSSCITPITLYNKKTSINSASSKTSFSVKNTKIQSVSSYVFGLINTNYSALKLEDICSTKWYSLKITRSFSDIITAILTLGIHTPLQVIIVCEPKIELSTKI